MVDTKDLKSFDVKHRVGSSPISCTITQVSGEMLNAADSKSVGAQLTPWWFKSILTYHMLLQLNRLEPVTYNRKMWVRVPTGVPYAGVMKWQTYET